MVLDYIVSTTTHVLPQDSTLTNIMDNTMNTALNTRFGVIALLSFIAALISAFFAVGSFIIGWRTMKAQVSTDNSTKGGKNIRSTQNLMLDMIRHFYWNYVISYGIAERMRQKNYRVYPSELHLMKMKVHMDSIDLHIFLDKAEDYRTLSNLFLLLRNYNFELEVINNHFKDKDLDDGTKEVDLKTLLFKCDFLTRKVVEALTLIWPDSNRNFFDEAKTIISHTQGTRWSEKESTVASMDSFTHYKGDDNTYYVTELFKDSSDTFIDNFNLDVAIELGKNNVGGYKITMIDL